VEQGHFALQVLPGTGASAGVSDFKLVFIHQLEVPPLNVFKRYQATGSFKAGDNLNTGCSASGWCSYRLKPARKYQLQHVQPKAVVDNCTTCSQARIGCSYRDGGSNRLRTSLQCFRSAAESDNTVDHIKESVLFINDPVQCPLQGTQRQQRNNQPGIDSTITAATM
jgi:hypothetical protein